MARAPHHFIIGFFFILPQRQQVAHVAQPPEERGRAPRRQAGRCVTAIRCWSPTWRPWSCAPSSCTCRSPTAPTWFPAGEPTRDPTAARGGALLPFGGYKGFGLALMMQALGLLAGSGSDAEREYGYLFVAFRPDLIGSADAFERQMTRLIERIKATPRRPGVDDIRIRSERAFHSRERALHEGLEIDRVVFDALVALRAR
jgi:hypothetical protein